MRSTLLPLDMFMKTLKDSRVLIQTHLCRIEAESGGDHLTALPYLPFEMWLTIMSFVQVCVFLLLFYDGMGTIVYEAFSISNMTFPL